LDKFSARIDSATTTIAELEEAIKGFVGELAEMDAAIPEASKIRNEERQDYIKASGDNKGSAEAVAAAIQVLQSYYEGSFLQLSAKTTLKLAGEAERWLGKLEEKGLEANVVSYNSVVAAWANAGNPEEAERWLAKLEEKGLEANVVSYTSPDDQGPAPLLHRGRLPPLLHLVFRSLLRA